MAMNQYNSKLHYPALRQPSLAPFCDFQKVPEPSYYPALAAFDIKVGRNRDSRCCSWPQEPFSGQLLMHACDRICCVGLFRLAWPLNVDQLPTCRWRSQAHAKSCFSQIYKPLNIEAVILWLNLAFTVTDTHSSQTVELSQAAKAGNS